MKLRLFVYYYYGIAICAHFLTFHVLSRIILSNTLSNSMYYKIIYPLARSRPSETQAEQLQDKSSEDSKSCKRSTPLFYFLPWCSWLWDETQRTATEGPMVVVRGGRNTGCNSHSSYCTLPGPCVTCCTSCETSGRVSLHQSCERLTRTGNEGPLATSHMPACCCRPWCVAGSNVNNFNCINSFVVSAQRHRV